MKNRFYLILITLILLLTGCNESTEKSNTALSLPHEKKTNKQLEGIQATTTKQTTEVVSILREEAPIIRIISKPPQKSIPILHHFEFNNLKNQPNILNIKNDRYTFQNIKQPIVIINIMATWCPPCRGQIPHLSKLQQKFKENVFVMSTLVHDDISSEKLNKFIIAQKMLFYVSINREENLKFTEMITPKLALKEDFPMPLTLVFVKNKYFTHYEGMIPEEMIESDIKQLLEKIKK